MNSDALRMNRKLTCLERFLFVLIAFVRVSKFSLKIESCVKNFGVQFPNDTYHAYHTTSYSAMHSLIIKAKIYASRGDNSSTSRWMNH